MNEKRSSGYGLICGCKRKIWVFPGCFQIMLFILKAGDRSIMGLQKSNFGLMNGIPEALSFNGIKEGQTIVEWYFKNQMKNGKVEAFDGVSLIEWTDDNKIMRLKEFGCNVNNYDPYQHGDKPRFKDEKTAWF